MVTNWSIPNKLHSNFFRFSYILTVLLRINCMEFVGPDSYMPGAASLLEQLDKKVLVILNDGRHLVGVLRSFDHFSNVVLEQTCERIISGGKYCDIHLGVYIVRGDNITLFCEIDEDKERNEMPLEKVEPEDLPDVAGEKDTVSWNFE